MNILLSKVNYALQKNGNEKLKFLFRDDQILLYENSEEFYTVNDPNAEFSLYDYIYHALKTNNVDLIKALKNIITEKEFNINVKINSDNIFTYYNMYDKQGLDITIKNKVMEELYTNLIESKDDYALEQTTDLFGEPFIIRVMDCEPVFKKLLEKWGSEDYFKKLKFKKTSKQFLDFFMREREATLGERCLIVKNNAPELFEKIREDLKSQGKWDYTKYSDPLLIFFLSDDYLLESEMKKDIEKPSNKKKKINKF